MPVYETNEGQAKSFDRTTINYICQGYADEDAALDALLADTPLTLPDSGHGRYDYEMTERLRDTVFKYRVEYLAPRERQKRQNQTDSLSAGEWQFSFDTTGVTETLTQSFGTKCYDSNGENIAKAAMFKNGIRVTGNGPDMKAEGVPVVGTKLGFNITARLENSIVTTAYAAKMMNLTGKTNNKVFPPLTMPFVDAQFAVDEVLFLGAVGSWRNDGDVDMNWQFDASPNVANLQTGDIIQIVKKGHQFLWFRYKTVEEAAQARTVLQATEAFVETVYGQGDFDTLWT